MDSEEQAFNLNNMAQEIIKLKYDCSDLGKEGALIKKVCDFFDYIKDQELSQTQIRFLYKFTNIIGVPQYFEMLSRLDEEKVKLRDVHCTDLSSMLYNSSLTMGESKTFHKYQKEVFDKFVVGNENRYFLTAPTSFGKTFIVLEIIKKMGYRNVVLIFPTLSLLAENYIRLLQDEYFSDYHIHTLSEDKIFEDEKNLFIYTPERFLSMTDKSDSLQFDFVFMDEIYKIDNQFIIDEDTTGENERDLSFRVALQLICKSSKDIMLAGPYIEISYNANSSIQNFFKDNNFKILYYNDIEVVNKSVLNINAKKKYNFEGLNFDITSKQKQHKLNSLLKSLYDSGNRGSIIYADTRYKTERLANWIIQFKQDYNVNFKIKDEKLEKNFYVFLQHVKTVFSEDWILYKALTNGIGIHHSYIPKYIQKEVIYFFNEGVLDTIISTTTITEGINTSAKNMIVMSDKKGKKTLKKFDAQNIAGRAGRFMCHFKGFVFAIDNNFNEILNSDAELLKNLEYDRTSEKSEVDIMMSKDKYLTEKQRISKKQLLEEAKKLGLEIDILKKFKTIKLSDKINLYAKILKMSASTKNKLVNVLDGRALNWDNFDLLLNNLYEIIENEDLKRLIEKRTEQRHSYLTVKVNTYLREGFPGVLKFEMGRNNVDAAVKETAKLTFNIFRYHLVKYLGLIDILLKFNLAKEKCCSMDEISSSVTILISFLEYSCTNLDAKKISDYGVPFKVIKYFDSKNASIYSQFDEYEKETYEKLKEKFKV